MEEVPIDAARFFFNLREVNSQMDFDLDLAVEKSSENPVYYVQYAHARICSILSKLSENGVDLFQAGKAECRCVQYFTTRLLKISLQLYKFLWMI